MEAIITHAQNDSFINQLVIKKKKTNIFINAAEIIWFEANVNYVKIHTATTVYSKKTSLKELELQLNPDFFVRIHRSTIISFGNIEYMFPYFDEEYIVVLKQGTVLRLSKAYIGKIPMIEEKVKQKSV